MSSEYNLYDANYGMENFGRANSIMLCLNLKLKLVRTAATARASVPSLRARANHPTRATERLRISDGLARPQRNIRQAKRSCISGSVFVW